MFKRTIGVGYEFKDGKNWRTTYVLMDETQVRTVVGMLQQQRQERIESARKLALALDELRRRNGGVTFAWLKEQIGVSVVSPLGIVTEAHAPLPARVCAFAFYAMTSPREDVLQAVVRQLTEWLGGKPIQNVNATALHRPAPLKVDREVL